MISIIFVLQEVQRPLCLSNRGIMLRDCRCKLAKSVFYFANQKESLLADTTRPDEALNQTPELFDKPCRRTKRNQNRPLTT